jgi:hypothetical protein
VPGSLGSAGSTRSSVSSATPASDRELIHLDTKKLGRIVRPSHRVTGDRRDSVDRAGWEFLHVAIDDATRLAYAEVLVDEKATTCVGFLARAAAFFHRHVIKTIDPASQLGLCPAVPALHRENGSTHTLARRVQPTARSCRTSRPDAPRGVVPVIGNNLVSLHI